MKMESKIWQNPKLLAQKYNKSHSHDKKNRCSTIACVRKAMSEEE